MSSAPRPVILSVDDESRITHLISLQLGRAGFDVMTAASGRDALEAVQRRRPDLILLDLMLPDIDGFGVCEILRSCEPTARIPVVMLTGWDSAEARAIGHELGAADYLSKPFKAKDLVARVKQLVAN
jgi:DNA-binding response OmpR family regulator